MFVKKKNDAWQFKRVNK